MPGMRLKGSYRVWIGGEAIQADNDITLGGLTLAARLLTGEATIDAVSLGLTDDGLSSASDTLDNHPGWQVLSTGLPTRLASEGASVVSEILSLPVTRDGVAGGCFLVVNGALFSVAEFEPRGVVQGDTVRVQYVLELRTAE